MGDTLNLNSLGSVNVKETVLLDEEARAMALLEITGDYPIHERAVIFKKFMPKSDDILIGYLARFGRLATDVITRRVGRHLSNTMAFSETVEAYVKQFQKIIES